MLRARFVAVALTLVATTIFPSSQAQAQELQLSPAASSGLTPVLRTSHSGLVFMTPNNFSGLGESALLTSISFQNPATLFVPEVTISLAVPELITQAPPVDPVISTALSEPSPKVSSAPETISQDQTSQPDSQLNQSVTASEEPAVATPTSTPKATPKATSKAKASVAKIDPTPSPTPADSPTNSPTETPTTPPNPTVGLSADKLFEMSNAHRKDKGLPIFQKDERACMLAASRAPEIGAEINGGFMHQGLKNRNLPYWNTENIISYRTEEEAFKWWINDYIHRIAIEGDYQYSCIACSGNSCAQEFTNFTPK